MQATEAAISLRKKHEALLAAAQQLQQRQDSLQLRLRKIIAL